MYCSLFTFDGAKVRQKYGSANNMLVLFHIPHLWYFATKSSFTLFIYRKKCDKKCKTFGCFKENSYFCQQKNLKPSVYVRRKRDFKEE